MSKFTDDKSILFHCTKVLLKTKDPEGLICSDSISINDGNLEKMTDEQIISCFDDIYQLGTSFIDTNKEKKQPIIHCAVNQKLLHKFFDRVRNNKSGVKVEKMIEDYLEIVEHELDQEAIYITDNALRTIVRGLSMLLEMHEMENFMNFPLFEKLIKLFKFATDDAPPGEEELPKGRIRDFAIQFLANCVPTEQFLTIIHKFQNYITLVIMDNSFS